MSESLITIEAGEREGRGKSFNRKLRRNGKVPAVLLNRGKATSIELDPKLLPKVYKTEGKKFNLKFGSETKIVCIKELAFDPIKRDVLHVDLMCVE